MAKVFNSFEKVAIKNAAKAIAAIQLKQERLKKSIETLETQIAAHDEEIKVFEDSVKGITGGYSPAELCVRKEREDGKQADWVFVYPDTIVPVVEESTTAEPETEEETPKVSVEKVSVAEPAVEDEFADAMPADLEPADPMDDIFKY